MEAFNNSLIQANTSIAASNSFKYFSGKAANVEKIAIFVKVIFKTQIIVMEFIRYTI